MRGRLRSTPAGQLDMLDLLDFQPASPTVEFKPETVRAASLASSIAKGLSQAIANSGRRREDVAKLMGEFLDEEVSVNMLNRYTSEASSEHIINVVRFIAFVAVTRDRRLLEFIASQFGWAVIDRKWLKAIEAAQLIEVRDEMNARIEAVKRQARREGAL